MQEVEGPSGSKSKTFEEFFYDSVVEELLDFPTRRTLPIFDGPRAVGDKVPLEPHMEVVRLGDWDRFDEEMRRGVRHHVGPWKRCISLLREMGAQVCVIEHQYVCLDQRSETATFHAQLDASAPNATIRLHFFSDVLDKDRLWHLSNEERESYLGYIVCREPGAPIVGRAVLKAPEYVEVAASVSEPVHFLGQPLRVRGVPFMQQDERFAICAQVCMWIISYSAYRRGMIERKLISDVVAASSSFRSMHPIIPDGLTPADVHHAMQALGLGTSVHETVSDGTAPFSSIRAESIAVDQELVARLEEVARSLEPIIDGSLNGVSPSSRTSFTSNPGAFVRNTWRLITEAQGAPDVLPGIRSLDTCLQEAAVLFDALLCAILEPYIRSGLPVYCDTGNHAIIFCGFAGNFRERIFYVHDDQFGPYLATNSLISASRDNFQWQAYSAEEDIEFDAEASAPKCDRAILPRATQQWPDRDRSVGALVIPSPARLLLSPSGAVAHAGRAIANAYRDWDELSSQDARNPSITGISAKIMMGIDYKSQRRQQAASMVPVDEAAITAFSTIHLSEWVIVVEVCLSPSDDVEWEFVYDGTSSDADPVLQFCRIGPHAAACHPRTQPNVEAARFSGGQFAQSVVPDVVGKISV